MRHLFKTSSKRTQTTTHTNETTMNEEELIYHEISEAVEKIQRASSITRFGFDAKFDVDRFYDKRPKFNKTYIETLREHYRVAVHADINCFPYELLRTKSPNQTQEEWDYQRGIYEHVTNEVWEQAKDKTKVIANPQNYSIIWPDPEQELYFTVDYPVYHSLTDYFFDIVRDRKIDYPNQMLLIEPLFIPGKFNDDKIFEPDQSVEVSPICKIIEEQDIIHYEEGVSFLIITDWDKERMKFTFGDKNTLYYYEVTQPEKEKPVITLLYSYPHNWGYCPARKLGGKPVIYENELMYLSAFSQAIPSLNQVIRLSSNSDMSTLSVMFPVRIVEVDICEYHNTETGQTCDRGRLYDRDTNAWSNCPSCNGTGRNSTHSPTAVYEVIKKNSATNDNTLALSPPVQFAAPSSDIYVKVEDTIKWKMSTAFRFLQRNTNMVAKTATESSNEQIDAQSFFLQFSNEVFNLMDFAIEGMGWMRWQGKFEKPLISPPNNFNFKTNAEITDEIGQAREKQLPQAYLKQLVKEGASTRFNPSPGEVKLIDFTMQVDRLWAINEADIRASVNVTISPVDVIIHQSITYLISQCELENENFWELPFEKQEAMIREKAQVISDALKTESKSASELLLGNSLNQ